MGKKRLSFVIGTLLVWMVLEVAVYKAKDWES